MNAPIRLDSPELAAVRAPLETAQTLPPWCYTSEEFYRLEVEKIFSRCWNFFGRGDRIPKPGDYFTVDFVGIPIVVMRGKDNRLRAFANTCRHRGARLLEGDGNTRAIKCPYHSWVYDLDGTLKGCAGMENVPHFDRSKYGLVELRLEMWGGYIFVNFDHNAESLLEYLGDFPEQFASYNCEDLVTVKRQEFDLACNWKEFIENAMEEYHLPTVHRQTLNLLEYKHGAIPALGHWDALREKHEGTRALLEEDQRQAFPHIKSLRGPAAEGSHFVCFYPSTMLGMTKDCVWTLELHPQGPHRTKMIFDAAFPRETVARADFNDKVQYYYKRWDKSLAEDNQISEVQHAGLSSPFARQGRLSPLEPLVHSIANWVLNWVADDNAPKGTKRLSIPPAHGETV